MTTHTFQVRKLHVAVKGKTLLSVDALDFPAASMTAVIGPNGAGKSTLLRALIGQTGQGEILLHGAPAAPQVRQGKAAWVGQHGRYNMPMSVRGYIGLAAYAKKGRLNHEQADALLAYFDLAALAGKRIGRLSGGEQQRANIIRALLQDAPVLLLDEPCNHLDIRHQHRLMQHLSGRKADTSAVMVLHDLNLAARYADHVILMDKGKVVETGSPEAVMRPELLEQVYGWPIRRCEDKDGFYFRS
ncbi:Iron(3+)-hydroxamate import ATP-binding protein FhuC [Kingella potus]|uniref:Iron(3+)-hydroxamate import ATP-binding protein FhuC n=1 Tax=Kingella potus TaxID=265175 RepID=A0A377R2H6_9NEIS|nr:ABC transporter ATP-binding protein [Kingella potus]UOO99878.1 ABC transporter ATP-binding protein [Kingella potus]STR03138.1 Iron(3+)-hydroxamate import ATP-binding protein FhuC [Kingella potus]